MNKTFKILLFLSEKLQKEKELNKIQPKPYGGTNPYEYCSVCERGIIETSYLGHYSNCKYEEIEKEIKSLKSKLKEEIKPFLENREFETNEFKSSLKEFEDFDELFILKRIIDDFIKNKYDFSRIYF